LSIGLAQVGRLLLPLGFCICLAPYAALSQVVAPTFTYSPSAGCTLTSPCVISPSTPPISNYYFASVTPSSANQYFMVTTTGANPNQLLTVNNLNTNGYVMGLLLTSGGSPIWLPPNSSVQLVYNGTAWALVNRFFPPNVYMVDGTTYSQLSSAYNDCVAANSQTNTCVIYDYYPQETSAAAPWHGVPWYFSGGEVPVHLYLGPGVFITDGPFTVPRLSQVIGSGRQGTSSTLFYGTIIQSTNTAFGGLMFTASGGSGCTTGPITISGGTYTALAKATVTSVSGGSYPVVVMQSLGSGYTSIAGLTLTFPGCTGTNAPSVTSAITNTVVYIGDSPNSNGATFGSRLENMTIDCNYATSCTGLEMLNAQEQSGPRNVNFFNWAHYGIHADGSGANNSTLTDVEVNGCFDASKCMIPASTTTPSIGIYIENAAVRVDKVTVNATNTPGLSGTSQLSAAACKTGGGEAQLTAHSGYTFNTSLLTSGTYVVVSGFTATGFSGIFQINTVTSSNLTYFTPCTSGAAPPITAASAVNLLLPIAVGVCGGPNCLDSSTSSSSAYGSVVFTGLKHTERAIDGTFVTGQVTYTDISPSCPSSGTLINCIHLDGGTNQPSFYLIGNLLLAGGAQVGIKDDGLGKTVTGTLIPQYSGGSAACPIDGRMLFLGRALTGSSSGSGSNTVEIQSPSTPSSCQIPPNTCLDIDGGVQHTTNTTYTDYAAQIADTSNHHLNFWLLAHDNGTANVGFSMRFCNISTSQTSNYAWFNSVYAGSGYVQASQSTSIPLTPTMYATSSLNTGGSATLQVNFFMGPATSSSSCAFSPTAGTPFASCLGNWSSSMPDIYTVNYIRAVLVPAL